MEISAAFSSHPAAAAAAAAPPPPPPSFFEIQTAGEPPWLAGWLVGAEGKG